jgi:hypothetical protein
MLDGAFVSPDSSEFVSEKSYYFVMLVTVSFVWLRFERLCTWQTSFYFSHYTRDNNFYRVLCEFYTAYYMLNADFV